MGAQVVFACPPSEEAPQSLEEVVYSIINLSWWEWGSLEGFGS